MSTILFDTMRNMNLYFSPNLVLVPEILAADRQWEMALAPLRLNLIRMYSRGNQFRIKNCTQTQIKHSTCFNL